METTKVVFRFWKEAGEIIAIFPELPSSTFTPNECESYMRVGQHGSCSAYAMVEETEPPSKYDYLKVNSLRKELEGRGYVLDEKKKISQAMHDNRRKVWEQLTQTAK